MAGTKLSDKEIKDRIKKAYHLRYIEGYGQEKYVKWAKEYYGDKSEQQFCQYFTKAKDVYDEAWRDKLQSLLGPATDELFSLLSSEDQKIRQRAIDQIMRYTGNDVQKVQADIKTDIKIKFGSDE